MTKEQEKQAELRAWSKEMATRDAAIVAEWKRTHKLPSRGVIDTPERRALRAEGKQRLIEIRKKYQE